MIGKKSFEALCEKVAHIETLVNDCCMMLKVRPQCSCSHDDNLRMENDRLKRMNEMLTHMASYQYNHGTMILYDEHNPRTIIVVKDGKKVEMDKAQSVSFNWYRDEFPTLDVTR